VHCDVFAAGYEAGKVRQQLQRGAICIGKWRQIAGCMGSWDRCVVCECCG